MGLCPAGQLMSGFLSETPLTVCPCLCPLHRKLAKKRKDAIGTARHEMAHMVNAMDRSYADQSTVHGEDPMAVTFMDSHNYNNRCRSTPLWTSFFIYLLYLWNSEVRGQHNTDVCYVLTPSSCLSTILVCEVFPDGVSFCSAQRPSGSYGRVRWDMGQCTVFHRSPQ